MSEIDKISVKAGEFTFTGISKGPGDGRPVLLLHGFPQTSWSWHRQLDALGDAGFRVVALDQHGYSPGARPADTASYHIDFLVSDVLELADALGMDKFDLVGHDWGGMVAWVAGARHPEHLRTLTVLSTPHPTAFGSAIASSEGDQKQRSSYISVFRQEGVAERALLGEDGSGDGLRTLFAASGLATDDVAVFVEAMSQPGALTAALNWYRATEVDSMHDVGQVAVPTMYIWSTDDIALGRDAAEATGAFVNAPYRFEVLEGVSHWVPEMAPDRVNALLLDFLGLIDPVDQPGFSLSDTQDELRLAVRKMCEERIAPHAAEHDRNATFPWDSFKACVEMELPALGIPVAYGGAGADHLTQAVVVEELARVCASTSLVIIISKLSMVPIMNWGTDELKSRYLHRVASGQSQASYCLSEADAGSDVAAMRCHAVRDGDHYVVSGTKYWITNAGASDVYTVFAKTDPGGGSRGISCFIVEADWGVEVSKLEQKMGMRASPTGEIVFDDVHVPVANRIGEEGDGFKIAMHTLDRSRPTIGAQAVGIAQGAIDVATRYMRERKAFGHAIADFQGLRFMVADMAMRTEAARSLVYRACSLIDSGDPNGDLGMFGAMAKCFASDTAMAVTTDAVQLLGGYGYTSDFPVERFMRDAKVTQIYEGTNQIQRVVISKKLLS